MSIWKAVDVADNQKALLYKRKRLIDVLTPGHYRINQFDGPVDVETYDTTKFQFDHNNKTFLAKEFRYLLSEHLQIIALKSNEIGLVIRLNRIVELIAPGDCFMAWRGTDGVKLEVINIAEKQYLNSEWVALFTPEVIKKCNSQSDCCIQYIIVREGFSGIVRKNGLIEDVLQPGVYGLLDLNQNKSVELVDMRIKYNILNNHHSYTCDGYEVQLNLCTKYQIVDPILASTYVENLDEFMQIELQVHANELLSKTKLKDLLAGISDLYSAITAKLSISCKNLGVNTVNVGINDLKIINNSDVL